MKVILEEIVKRHPIGVEGAAGQRYRRTQLGLFDVPVEMLPVLRDGFVLVIDEDSKRRKLVVADVRVAAICDNDDIGLILDLIDPVLYKAIDEDQDAPADYEAFCKLENIEP